MRVIGYVRVSTEDQASTGVSLQAQTAKLEQYAALYDLDLVDVIVDAGASAKNLNRDGLQSALQVLDSGEAEGLLIAKLDRLTRSVKDMGELLDGYFSSRFALISVADQMDTSTAAGRLVLNVLTSVAQWEREAIGERTSAALRHKQAQGEHVGAAALGFDLIDGKLEENDEEQATLRRVRELRGQGLPLRAVAAALTEEGFTTKRGGKWYASTVGNYCKRLGEEAV